jgi:GGDEF domain-containing protein
MGAAKHMIPSALREVCLGGDSFAILLPRRSLSDAEALRHQVSEHVFTHLTRRMSVSLCTSTTLLQESDPDPAAFVKRAAEQLDQVGASTSPRS